MFKKLFFSIFTFARPIFVLALIFYFLYDYSNIQVPKVNALDFLFQFLGILLGFALTIFQFIVSLVDKIIEKKEVEYKGLPERLEALRKKSNELYREIKDDILFIFYSLVIISIMYFINSESSNTPEQAIRSAIFCLNIYAVYDLISVSFKVSDITTITRDQE
jgi:hypothetical protein